MADREKTVNAEMEKFRALQGELQELAQKRQHFVQQANENGMVKKELDMLEEDAKVYKLVGPVLIKQDVEDAKTTVDKRLEFIGTEAEKLNKKLSRKEAEATEVRKKIMEIQSDMQKSAVEAAKAAVK